MDARAVQDDLAVVSTHALIPREELGETFALAERLMDDPHHLMQQGDRMDAAGGRPG